MGRVTADSANACERSEHIPLLGTYRACMRGRAQVRTYVGNRSVRSLRSDAFSRAGASMWRLAPSPA